MFESGIAILDKTKRAIIEISIVADVLFFPAYMDTTPNIGKLEIFILEEFYPFRISKIPEILR